MKVIQKYVISWLSLSLLCTAISYSANTRSKTSVREEIPIQAEKISGPRNSGIAGNPDFARPSTLAENSPYIFDTAGTSYYDANGIDRNPRQITLTKNGNVAIAWGKSTDANLTAREVFATIWRNANKNPGDVIMEKQVPPLGGLRTGFCGVDYLPLDGRLVFYYHHSYYPRGTYAVAETVAGSFGWNTEVESPDSLAGNADPGWWPSAAGGFMIDGKDYDGDGDTTDSVSTIHFFSTEGSSTGPPYDYIYSRAVDSGGIWIFPGFYDGFGNKIDTGMQISPTVVTSKKTPRVALIYSNENACNLDHFCSDIYFHQSTNSGENWIYAGIPVPIGITYFSPTDSVRATGDLMGVYDQGDSLVIAYLTWTHYIPSTGEHSEQTDINVWTNRWGNRKAVDGDFSLMPSLKIPDASRSTLNYPHLAVHDGTTDLSKLNYYYLVFTQYGGNDSIAWSDTASNGFLNGEIYVTVSTNRGLTWTQPLNLTNSKTPDCSIGQCSGVSYSSCAERANDTLHVAFMSDLYSGNRSSGEQGPFEATDNPITYMKVPTSVIPSADTLIYVYPDIFPHQNPGSYLTDTFYVSRAGSAELIVDSIRHMTSNPWLTLSSTAGFVIEEWEAKRAILFTVSDFTLADGIYVDTIFIYNNASNAPEAKVIVRMVVDEHGGEFITPAWDTLDNGVVRVSVSNVGNLGSLNNSGFYRIVGNDTTNNLIDGSTIMAVIMSNGDSVVGRWIYNSEQMWPQSPLFLRDTTVISAIPKPGTKVKIPPGNYIYASTAYAVFFPFALGVEYPGPWFWFLIRQEWWLPKLPNPAWHPVFVLDCQNVEKSGSLPWWPETPAFDTATTTVYFGKALDWNVFSDSEGVNFGWPAYGTGAVWQQGAARNYEQNFYPIGHFAFLAHLDSLDQIDPFAMHLVSNQRFVYPSNGYIDAELYQIASDTSTDVAKYIDSLRFPMVIAPADYNSVLTNLKLDPPYQTASFCNLIGVVGDTASDYNSWQAGCDSLALAYNQARAALGLGQIDLLSAKLNCAYPDCPAKPGDANASSTYTLGDIIATLNYNFNKPGCTPVPLCWLSNLVCRGDWNGTGTITLGDVIRGVNFIFNKPGGPWYPLPSGSCCRPYDQ